MKKVKFHNLISVLTIILCLCMLNLNTAFADENSDTTGKTIINKIDYPVVSDPETLLQMAAEQYQQQNSLITRSSVADDQLFIDQLVSETYYSDGSVVKDYVRDTFVNFDSENQIIPLGDWVCVNDYYQYNKTHNNILVTLRTNYQACGDTDELSLIGGTFYVRITNCVVTVIGDQYSGHRVDKLDIGIWSTQDLYLEGTKGCSTRVNSPASNTPYTLYNTDTTQYQNTGTVYMYATTDVYFDDNHMFNIVCVNPWTLP